MNEEIHTAAKALATARRTISHGWGSPRLRLARAWCELNEAYVVIDGLPASLRQGLLAMSPRMAGSQGALALVATMEDRSVYELARAIVELSDLATALRDRPTDAATHLADVEHENRDSPFLPDGYRYAVEVAGTSPDVGTVASLIVDGPGFFQRFTFNEKTRHGVSAGALLLAVAALKAAARGPSRYVDVIEREPETWNPRD